MTVIIIIAENNIIAISINKLWGHHHKWRFQVTTKLSLAHCISCCFWAYVCWVLFWVHIDWSEYSSGSREFLDACVEWLAFVVIVHVLSISRLIGYWRILFCYFSEVSEELVILLVLEGWNMMRRRRRRKNFLLNSLCLKLYALKYVIFVKRKWVCYFLYFISLMVK